MTAPSQAATKTLAVGVSRNVRLGILATDAVVLTLATFFGFVTRFSFADLDTSLVGPIQVVGTLAPLLWLVVLALVGSYEQRVVGLGLSEYGRILQSALWMVALISIVSFLGKFDTSRAYVLIVIPLGLVGLLIDRWAWRRWILHKRNQGQELQSTIVIGDANDRERISSAFEERRWAGYTVVAGANPPDLLNKNDEHAFAQWLDHLMHQIESHQIMCVALAPSCGLNGAAIRELSWRIEGRGIDLLISSALGAVTGPRITMRVATGLPFLHLDEVGIGLTKRAVKRAMDILVSAVTLIILSPILLLITLLLAITSGTPILFNQERRS
jgi:FlaA1/EpsC-like NDP-sugar epimerase